MSDQTKIEWTDATWNVVTGCTVISPGCTNCYAMKLVEFDHDDEVGLSHVACAVRPVWIARDGRQFAAIDDLPADMPCRMMERLGKKRAGRLLDGVEHNGMPS